MTQTLYEQDFHAWSNQQAELFKAKKFDQLDWENLAEEIKDMGKREKRAFESTLIQLLMHMLKWKYQNNLQNSSWEISIKKQRKQLNKLLKENPSFKIFFENKEFMEDIFDDAIMEAQIETKLPEKTFPKICEWNIEQILDDNFFPN